MVACSLLGFVGFAVDSHIGESARLAAYKEKHWNRFTEARALMERAVFHLRFRAPPWLGLTEVLADAGAPPARTLETAEHAVFAPFSSDWNERMRASATAGTMCLLLNTPDGNQRAQHHLATAVAYWRRCHQLDIKVAAQALYNLACAESRLADPLAVAELMEALALDETLRAGSLEDADFAYLHLPQEQSPSDELLARFARLSAESEAIREAVSRGLFDRNELLQIAGWMAKH